MKKRLQNILLESDFAFIIWAIVASFGAYFCMYAFRKPFSAGLYEDLFLWGVGYKAILIISQVAGYTISKFAGIKVISELEPKNRIWLIITLIVLAEAALFFFGVAQHPYSFFFLFLNGLPLGMVYGVVFSFLEGRRLTEMLAMGLSISVVIASGILKTIYIDISQFLPGITEFWMPSFMGLIFLPFFLFFVWMLSIIPNPTAADIRSRTERLPMSAADKREVLTRFGIPVFCLVVCYAGLVVLRDFRDNFMIEIWNEIDANWESGVLAQTELICGFVVFIIIGSLVFVKSNLIGFRLTNVILMAGMLFSASATYLFQNEIIDGFTWMLSIGIGFFLAYTAIQTVIFERFIALFKIKANAGYFVYMCESIGYLGSASLLLYKEFFMKEMSWSQVMIQFIYTQVGIAVLLLIVANINLEYERSRKNRIKNEFAFQ